MNRRQFFSTAAGVSLTAAVAPSVVSGQMSAGREVSRLGMANVGLVSSGIKSVSENPLAQIASAARTKYENIRSARAYTGGFDPDIASMRSLSLDARFRIQRERDERMETFLQKLWDKAWG